MPFLYKGVKGNCERGVSVKKNILEAVASFKGRSDLEAVLTQLKMMAE